jgi:WD40 repeat protein
MLRMYFCLDVEVLQIIVYPMKNLYLILSFLTVVASNYFGQTTARGAGVSNADERVKGKTYAVLIGVSDYSFLPYDQQLKFADDDAHLLNDYLQTWGEIEVKMFLNEEASTRNMIGGQLKMVLRNAQPNDHVILFFAGHGDVDSEKGDGYLLLSEVTPASQDTYEFNEAISLTSLKKMIDDADKSGVEVTLIADACRSGAVFSSDANTMMSGITRNAVTMVSCQYDQFSEESEKYGAGHGAFTYYLVQGLMGLADDDKNKVITLVELRNYLELKLKEARKGEQTPEVKGRLDKEITEVQDEIVKIAKEHENKELKIPALAKKKSILPSDMKLNSECEYLVHLLQEKAYSRQFFEDELGVLDKQEFAIGSSNVLKNFTKPIDQAIYSAKQKYFAVLSEGHLSVYQAEDLAKTFWYKERIAYINSVSFNPSNTAIAAGSEDGYVRIFDPSCGELINTHGKSGDAIGKVHFLYSNLLAYGTKSGKLIIWDSQTNEERIIKVGKGKVSQIEFSYPFIACATDQGNVKLLNCENYKELTVFSSKISLIGMKILSKEGNLLLVSSDGSIQKWSIKGSNLIKERKLDKLELTTLEIDPLERFALIGTSNKNIEVIDLFNLNQQPSKVIRTKAVTSLSYDLNNYLLVVGCADGSLSFQQLKTNLEQSAAIDIHKRLGYCTTDPIFQNKIDGTLIIGLNNEVNSVLKPLVNGHPKQPAIDEIKRVKRYALKAMELGMKYPEDLDKLEANYKLLEIYEVLLERDLKRYDLVKLNLDRLLEIDSLGAYVYNLYALYYSSIKEFEKSHQMSERAEQLAPRWSEPTCTYGKILHEENNRDVAEQKYRETIKKSPDLSKGYYNLAKLYFEQNLLDSALANLEKAMWIDSGVVTIQKLYQELNKQIYDGFRIVEKSSNGVDNSIEKDMTPSIVNKVFYAGYQNSVKGANLEDYSLVPQGASYVRVKNEEGKTVSYKIRPFNDSESVEISIMKQEKRIIPKSHRKPMQDTIEYKIVKIQQVSIPVKPIPQPTLVIGKSVQGGHFDLKSDKLVFKLDDAFNQLEGVDFRITGYTANILGYKLDETDKKAVKKSFNAKGDLMDPKIIEELRNLKSLNYEGEICFTLKVASSGGVENFKAVCYYF